MEGFTGFVTRYKTITFVSLCLILMVFLCGSAWARAPVIVHDLDVILDPSRHRLEAVDRISISGEIGRELKFSMWPDLKVTRVLLDKRPARYRFGRGLLAIVIPKSEKPLRLEVAYWGTYDDPAPVQPLNTDNPGFGVTGTIEEKGTMLLAGSGWYPHADGPQRFRITVDAPQGVLALTSGTSLGHDTSDGRTRSRWSVDAPLRGLSLVAGRYVVKTRDFGGVTAATYFSPELQDLSSDYLDAVGRYLQLYSELFGAYAFGQFAVVENFFPTGYAFPGYTLMGRRVLQLPFIKYTSLGHEVAHCWWGNGVLVDPSQGNWSEGLTTYVSDYLYKEHQGKGLAHRRQWLRNYASLVDEHDESALSGFMSRTDPATKAMGYDKGAMVFHMLRQKVGDDLFWASLKEIYARHRFEAVTWTGLQRVFEEKSGRDFEGFFSQWVFRAGSPRLALADVAVNPVEGGFSIQGNLTQTQPYYDLQVALSLQTVAETVHHRIEVRGPKTPFRIAAAAEPRQLTLDPDVHLFRRLAPAELPPTVNRLRGSDAVMVVVTDPTDQQLTRLARRLMLALGHPSAAIGGEAAFARQDLEQTDVIYVGLPEDRFWLGTGGSRLAIDDTQFSLLGQNYPLAGSNFFGVFASRSNYGRLAAVFMPGDLPSASAVSRKIPHYGRYSYLVFNGSTNQAKGTWPVEDSTTMVRWKPGPVRITGGDR